MSSIGGFLKNKFPGVYKALVDVINQVIALSQPYMIYITDNLGGSFKTYFQHPDMVLKTYALQKNLDQESVRLINVMMQRFKFYPDAKDRIRTSPKEEIAGGLLPVETEVQRKEIDIQLKATKRSLNLGSSIVEASVFYFYHGLTLLPRQVDQYIRHQHFIDVGAYVGDSAVALAKYEYRKIFSLEISQKSIARYYENLGRSTIGREKYEIINVGVAASNDESPLTIFDTGSAGLSLFRKTGKYDEIHVERRTLDWVVETNNIRPKFIKVDIEGAGMDFVKGATNTLKTYRPVLSLAIYHNPVEFFEIKPKLEKLLSDYVFLIRKLTPGLRNNLIHSEVVLLGYPKELMASD